MGNVQITADRGGGIARLSQLRRFGDPIDLFAFARGDFAVSPQGPFFPAFVDAFRFRDGDSGVSAFLDLFQFDRGDPEENRGDDLADLVAQIELLLNRHEPHVLLAPIGDDVDAVAEVSAHPVQLPDHDGLDFAVEDRGLKTLKGGAIEVTA